MRATVTYLGPNAERSIAGLGCFPQGQGRPVELTDQQARNLSGKGFQIEPEAEAADGGPLTAASITPGRRARKEKE